MVRMPFWWPFPVVFAFVFSALMTPFMGVLARRYGILDMPSGDRKVHTEPTPLLGGVSVFLAFALPVFFLTLTTDVFTSGEIHASHIFGVLLSGAILMVGGYLDDRYSLPPKLSILFPFAAALIATFLGIGIEKMTNPFGGYVVLLPIVSTTFTFLWLMGMTYTTKLLDGLDGLAGSVTAIGALMIASLALTEKYYQPDVVLLAFLFLAAILGFLLWNYAPAQIFLGEGGSTFLGFTLGVLAVIAGSKVATTLLVLGLPALDVFIVITRRILAGRSATTGDRYHFHHLLIDNGLTPRVAVLLYAALCFLFGLTTLLFSSFEKLIALVVLSAILVGLIILLERRKRSR